MKKILLVCATALMYFSLSHAGTTASHCGSACGSGQVCTAEGPETENGPAGYACVSIGGAVAD